MSLKIGIVGLPNVGKSTLFNALMKRAVAAAANHPFTTIEPNIGIVDLPDERLQRLYDVVVNPKSEVPNDKQIQNIKPINPKIIPATVTFIDIAGIIKGASKGEGLGNQFLSHIREADALAIVLRCFKNDNIIHVAGTVDPLDDAKTVLLELILADLSTLQKKLDALAGDVRAGNKDALGRSTVYRLLTTALESEQLASTVVLTDEQKTYAKEVQLMTLKPILYVANVAEEDSNKSAEAVTKEWNLGELMNGPIPDLAPGRSGMIGESDQAARKLMVISAKVEAEVAELDESEGREYLESLGLTEPGLNRLIRSGFSLLGLATYFTAGVTEVRAWTIKQGFKAPQAAGVIHGDFEKGFIRAEVIAYEDYVALSGEQGAKQAGKMRSEGKEYIVSDGDVMHFRFNV